MVAPLRKPGAARAMAIGRSFVRDHEAGLLTS